MSKHHKPVYLIAAVDKKFGIGAKGKLIWNLKEDMRFFQKTTEHSEQSDKENVVIMGRTTWESIPEAYRPLKGRRNFVLTRNGDYEAEGGTVFKTLNEAIKSADNDEFVEKIFIIGGASVYKESILHPDITGVYLTKVNSEYNCDVFFPKIPKYFKNIKSLGKGEEKGVSYEFLLYEK